MTARTCRLSWMASVSHAPVDVDGLAPAQTDLYRVASFRCSLSLRQILSANSKLRSLCAWMPPLVRGQISPLSTRLPGVNRQFACGIPSGGEPGTRAERDSTTVWRDGILSPIRATAIRAVGACCVRGRSSTPSPSDATSACNGRLDRGARSSSILPSTLGATWSSTVSIGSSSGAGWRRATRSMQSTTAPCSSSPRSSSGSKGDSSDSPIVA